jgi:hypothetical protein
MPGGSAVVRRLKNGLSVEHPIAGDEMRAIKPAVRFVSFQEYFGRAPVVARPVDPTQTCRWSRVPVATEQGTFCTS